MSEQRSIRDILMTYGVNGGKRLSDDDYATLLADEVNNLPDDAKPVFEQRYAAVARGATIINTIAD